MISILFLPQLLTNWLSISSLDKADGHGSKNKEKDSLPLQFISKNTNLILQENFWKHTTLWLKSSFLLQLSVCLHTFHNPQAHLKSITFNKWLIVFTKELKNLTILKENTITLLTDSLDYFTDCDLFETMKSFFYLF